MALSTVVKSVFDGATGSLVAKDGTGTPLTSTVRYQDGFTADGLGAERRAVTAYQNRAALRSLRHTELTFPTLSFTQMLTEFSETGTGTLVDLVEGTAGTPYATRVSTTAAKGDVITLDLVFTVEGTNFGDSKDHTITFEDVHLMWSVTEGDPSSISWTGTCYGTVTIT